MNLKKEYYINEDLYERLLDADIIIDEIKYQISEITFFTVGDLVLDRLDGTYATVETILSQSMVAIRHEFAVAIVEIDRLIRLEETISFE